MAKQRKKKLHWTQRPENKAKMLKQLKKANKARRNNGHKTDEVLKDTIPEEQTASKQVEKPEPSPRASEKSYVLSQHGSKVYIRNLSDVALLMNRNELRQEIKDLNTELDVKQRLNWELTRESEFREL